MPLWCVTIYAVKTTFKRGLPVCEPDFRTGPLWAETEAEVDAQATAWVKRTFPAHRDWSGHAQVLCQVPDSLVRQAASELERAQEPTLARKQRRKTRERNEE